ENFQELEFYGSKLDLLVSAKDDPGFLIQFNVSDAKQLAGKSRGRLQRLLQPGSSQDGVDPGHQFPRGKGLLEIICSSNLQPHNAIHLVVASRHNQHGNDRFSANTTQHIETIEAGKDNVENNQDVFAGK